MRLINTLFICFILVLPGCALLELEEAYHPRGFADHSQEKLYHESMSSSTGNLQSGNLNISNGAWAAQTLVNKAYGTIKKESPMIIASFVDSDDVTSTNGFGRMLSQQFSTQLVDSGYNVVELLLRENVYITEKGGEFLLSRQAKDLSKHYKAHAAVVGTYVVGYDTIFVNSKVVDISTNTILAAYNFTVALDANVKSMLDKSPYVH